MYLRISHGTFDASDPTKRSDAAAISRDAADIVAGLPGFVRYVAGTDDTGRYAAVSLWQTEEAAKFDRSVFGGIMERASASGLTFEAAQLLEVDVDRSSSS